MSEAADVQAVAPSRGQQARSGVAWTTGLYLFRDALQFGLMLVLVRRLPVEAYGQFGLINSIIGFILVFSSREFIAHTVLVRDDRDVNYQEQFVAGCFIQGTLFVLTNVLAIALRFFPTYAPVAPLLHIASLVIILDLPSELRVRMLERALDWRHLRIVEAVGILSAAVLAIALALFGGGVYALILPSLVIPFTFMIDLFVVAGWRPTFEWRPERYKASRDFGFKRTVSVSFVSASNLLESGVLTRVSGYASLGLFGRAQGLASLFCQRVSTLLMASLYPVLARIQPGSDAYRRTSGIVLRAVVWTMVPVAVCLSLLGPEVIATLYGTRWTEVIPLVPLGMAVGACLAVVQAAYGLLLAHHEARKCLYADVWRLAGMGLALAIALPFGLRPYMAGLLVVHGVALILILYWLKQSDGLRFESVGAAFVPATIAAVAATACAETARRFVFDGWPTLLLMCAFGAVFGVTYLAVIRTLFAGALRELVAYLPQHQRVHRLLRFAEA